MLSKGFNLSNINIAVVGCSGVGKTSLVSAITYALCITNSAKYCKCEEIIPETIDTKSGVTFAVASVDFNFGSQSYTLYDFASTNDFLKCLITKAIRIDGIIYVTHAEGFISPSDKIALSFARSAGIQKIVAFLNKTDEVDSDIVEFTEYEVDGLLSDMCFDTYSYPYVSGSTKDALNYGHDIFSINTLLEKIEENIVLNEEEDEDFFGKKLQAAVYVYRYEESNNYKCLSDEAVIEFVNSGKAFECKIKIFDEMLMPGDIGKVNIELNKFHEFYKNECFIIYDKNDNSKKVACGFVATRLD